MSLSHCSYIVDSDLESLSKIIKNSMDDWSIDEDTSQVSEGKLRKPKYRIGTRSIRKQVHIDASGDKIASTSIKWKIQKHLHKVLNTDSQKVYYKVDHHPHASDQTGKRSITWTVSCRSVDLETHHTPLAYILRSTYRPSTGDNIKPGESQILPPEV